MLGKTKKIRADLSENILNSVISSHSGKLVTAPLPRKASAPYAYDRTVNSTCMVSYLNLCVH